ncbi:MAG TPA: calcium/sodium antiporter [Gammaproteobacteria bacterium]|nr:calcium/sodium antiporter [Gammaproteobacteria bacterium]
MLLSIAAILLGIVLLVFSADKFVEGAAVTSKHLGLPPLLVGMLVIGFGSSMPEMVISFLSAYGGSTGLALGNALGSNITNIALILGLTAIISPIAVGSTVIHRELPLMLVITAITAMLIYFDGKLDRIDGLLLVGVFLSVMCWSIYEGVVVKTDHLAEVVDQEYEERLPLKTAVIFLALGLLALVISSQILVWGGVEIAQALGVSDLIIGLTIVAIGTSLPELASAIAAVRKNEHDLALGNVIGSNIFNISIVIGIAAGVSPSDVHLEVMVRDLPVLGVMTVALFIMCWGFRGEGRINRLEGGVLLAGYIGYNVVLVMSAILE